MADDSALRATLKELKVVADSEEARKPVSGAKPTTPPGQGGGSSLLSDLLAETSGEAQRELDQIKQQLASKRAEAEDLAKQQEEERRRQLDALRRQEAERREAMIARRSGVRTREQVDSVPDEEGPAPTPAAAPKKKSSNVIFYVLGLLLLAGAGVGGWWFMGQQGDQRGVVTGSTAEIRAQARAEAEKTRAAAAAEAHAKAQAEKAAAEAAASEHHAAMIAMVRSRTEPEAEGYPRRMLSLSLPTAEKPVAKAGKPKKPGKARKPGTRRTTGKRIKIRGLDLGGSR